ncbi:MAG: hypothetical protein PHQ14_06100 [Chromatiales bacterium]|nr:hypothetical protein [Chromatiales bacterium]
MLLDLRQQLSRLLNCVFGRFQGRFGSRRDDACTNGLEQVVAFGFRSPESGQCHTRIRPGCDEKAVHFAFEFFPILRVVQQLILDTPQQARFHHAARHFQAVAAYARAAVAVLGAPVAVSIDHDIPATTGTGEQAAEDVLWRAAHMNVAAIAMVLDGSGAGRLLSCLDRVPEFLIDDA